MYTFAGGAYMPTTKLGTIARRAAKGTQVEDVQKGIVVAETDSVEPAIEEDEHESIE
jgi:hypothetical protein